jgi:hypothetical protein
MFDRGESKDDLELSYHCSSATHSEPEEEEEDLDTLQMGVPLNTGTLAPLSLCVSNYMTYFLFFYRVEVVSVLTFYFRRWLINIGLLFRPQFCEFKTSLNVLNRFFLYQKKSLRQCEEICETVYWQKICKKYKINSYVYVYTLIYIHG